MALLGVLVLLHDGDLNPQSTKIHMENIKGGVLQNSSTKETWGIFTAFH